MIYFFAGCESGNKNIPASAVTNINKLKGTDKMLDENQYEEFRFVGMGEKAAVKQFKADIEKITDPDAKAAELKRWEEKLAEENLHADLTEKSVMDRAFADQMVRLWKKEVQ